jgi:hypothetical protein
MSWSTSTTSDEYVGAQQSKGEWKKETRELSLARADAAAGIKCVLVSEVSGRLDPDRCVHRPKAEVVI